MTGTMVRQTMFTTGEVDEQNYKRTDMSDIYMTAAQSLLNCEVGTTGLVKKRKGTQSVLDVTGYAEAYSRLFDFVDKNGKHYIVIASNLAFYIIYISIGDEVLINYENKTVVNYEGKSLIVSSGTAEYVQIVGHNYTTSDIVDLDYTVDADSIVFSHQNFRPGRLFVSSYTIPFPTFEFEFLNIAPHYPTYDFNKVNYNDFDVAFSVTGSTFTATFTGTNVAFSAEWINGILIGLGAGNTESSSIGYGLIRTYSGDGSTTATFTGTVIVAFAPNAQMPTKGSQYSVRQPAWSDTLGWPRKVAFYQNRLWFASTPSLPDTVFGSKINSPANFDVGIGRDPEAIVYSIGQSDPGNITWLNGGKQLEIYTENFEFACPQDENSGLTPSSFSIRQQSSYGSSNEFKPITYINNSYYTSRSGKSFNIYNFTGVGLAYQSKNISAASSHLMKSPFNRALQRGTDTSQDNFIYLLNDDSTITAFQFSNEIKLAAFTPIKFQEGVNIIDILSSNNEIYLLKLYTKTGIFMLEKMNDLTKIDGYAVNTISPSGIISGLEYYNGYTVQVIYKDQDYGEYLVVNGEITVINPPGVSDTVNVGLLYSVEIKPMYLFAGQNSSALKKSINQIYVDYYKSLDFYINDRLVPYQNYSDLQNGIPIEPKTDTVIVDSVYGWERFQTIKISQNSPFDLQILSISYSISATVI